MLKTLNRLWWSGLKQAVRVHKTLQRQQKKQQQQAGKLRRAAAAPVAGKTSRPSTAKTPRDKAASGTWRSGYHTVPSALDTTRRLRYQLFLPAAAPRDLPQPQQPPQPPLLVMLHGCRQHAEVFAAGTRMNALAAQRGYAVLYPEQSPRVHPQRCWKWYDSATVRGAGQAAAIAALIDSVATRHGIDRQRIYVCGISAGAAMAQIVALNHPQLVAAVGLHCAPVFGSASHAAAAYRVMQLGALRPLAPIDRLLQRQPAFPGMPAIIIAGRADEVVRPVNHHQLEAQFLRLQGQADIQSRAPLGKPFGRASRQYPLKRQMTISDHLAGRKLLLRAVLVDGLGHAWSGGDSTFDYNAPGPDASRMMLDFFARQRR